MKGLVTVDPGGFNDIKPRRTCFEHVLRGLISLKPPGSTVINLSVENLTF